MEYSAPIKKAKLDFTRETFNEYSIKKPALRDTMASLPGNLADDESSSATNDSDCLHASAGDKELENVNVYLRLRPARDVCSLYEFQSNKVVVVSSAEQAKNTEKHYKFTSVLNESVDQVEVYDKIVRSTLTNPFASTGATFASYGVSSSGKTFTILGDNDYTAGLIPRAVTQIFTEFQSSIAEFPCVKIVRDEIKELNDEQVFAEIDARTDFFAESSKMLKGKPLKSWSPENIRNDHKFQLKDVSEDEIERLYVWVSFVEIHNERITDLLYNAPSKSTLKTLKIYSNNGYSYIPCLTSLFVSKIDDAMSVLKYGLSKVCYAATGINDRSSRSHTIFMINLIAENKTGFQYASYKFCDLAGAERLKKTGNVGERLKEAGGINNSLLVLGRCLEAVQQNQTNATKKIPDIVVPVRNSKLTLLIQSSLLGYEKFFMIVNLYPTSDFFEENLNVLKFASIAKQIVVRQTEVRKFKRQSSRFSLLMQQQLNGSTKNFLNGTITEEGEEESDLDVSFQWNQMSKEQLIAHMHKQKREIEILHDIFVKKEHENLEAEMRLRRQAVEQHSKIRENLSKRNDEDKKFLEEYHEKKMENLRISYERKLSEAYDEIDFLTRKLKKYEKKRMESCDDEGEEEEEDDDDCADDEEEDDDDNTIEIID